MRSLIQMGLVAALLLGVLAWTVSKQGAARKELEYHLARAELRAEFLQRAPWVWSLEDPARYTQESRGLFTWYVEQARKLRARFPDRPDDDAAFLEELDRRLAEGRISQRDHDGFRASYEQVEEVWEAIAGGRYEPVMTGSHASLRIDFLPPRPSLVDGQRALEGRFVVWGAQRTVTEEPIGKGTQARIQTHASFHDVEVDLFDGRGKQLGQLTFGLPFGPYVPVPEQRIEDFPPLGFVGNYAIPLVPHEAESMKMVASLVSRAVTGTSIQANFVWEQPVPASWKLGEGEAWEGAGVGFRDE